MAPIAHSIRNELQTVKSFRSVGVTQIVADSEFHENESIDLVESDLSTGHASITIIIKINTNDCNKKQ